jgi:hypothetical protein
MPYQRGLFFVFKDAHGLFEHWLPLNLLVNDHAYKNANVEGHIMAPMMPRFQTWDVGCLR